MIDNSWRDLETWERVKWARAQCFETAAAAAGALDMEEGTYRCYERGPDSSKFIRLDYEHARKFARAFKVQWEWLLEGLGEPWLTPPEAPKAAAAQERPRHHLRAWREHRGLTVAELAKRSQLGPQTIAGLESGQADLSEKLLYRLADALSTTAGWILDHDPADMDSSLLEAARAVPKERRKQALQILKTFRSPKPR
jgi:transcriptional regulator with XRE-family HTH domain